MPFTSIVPSSQLYPTEDNLVNGGEDTDTISLGESASCAVFSAHGDCAQDGTFIFGGAGVESTWVLT